MIRQRVLWAYWTFAGGILAIVAVALVGMGAALLFPGMVSVVPFANTIDALIVGVTLSVMVVLLGMNLLEMALTA